MKSKILHVLQWLELGGAELVALELARAQRRSGHHVALLVLRAEDGPLAERARGAGLEVLRAGGSAGGLDPSLYGRVRRILAERQPDVVHTHDPGSLLYCAPVARLLGAVVVHTKHGHDTEGTRRRWAARVASAFLHKLVAVSADVAAIARRAREVPERKLIVIENGVDTERFAPSALSARRASARQRLALPSAAAVIGCVARLEAVKRHSLLLEAVLPTLGEERRLLLVGDGSLRPALEAQARAHPLGRFVTLAGLLDEPLDALAALDVFVLPSSHEGLPLALLEALSCGVPVVASSVGGIPKVVEHGVSGWLVALGDPGDPEALRMAIDGVLANHSAQRQLVAESARRRVVESYSLQRATNDYLDLYERLSSRRAD